MLQLSGQQQQRRARCDRFRMHASLGDNDSSLHHQSTTIGSRKRKRCQYHHHQQPLPTSPMVFDKKPTTTTTTAHILWMLLLLMILVLVDVVGAFVPLSQEASSSSFHARPSLEEKNHNAPIFAATDNRQRIHLMHRHFRLWALTETIEPEKTTHDESIQSSSLSIQTFWTASLLEDHHDSPEQQPQQTLPPWLARYDHHHITAKLVKDEMLPWLEFSLRQQQWSPDDIQDILRELQYLLMYKNNDNASLVAGCVDFLRTYLHVFAQQEQQQGEGKEEGTASRWFVSKHVLLAAMQHYADCIAIRKQGIHNVIRQSILQQEPGHGRLDEMPQPTSSTLANSSSQCNIVCIGSSSMSGNATNHHEDEAETSTALVPLGNMKQTPRDGTKKQKTKASSPRRRHHHANKDDEDNSVIVRSAARIKRAEILSQVFLANAKMSDTKTAQGIRSLLLAVTEDFRALAIRCVACLFRLEGILQYYNYYYASSEEFLERTPEIIRTAKEGMRVYAPLAQRMGLPKLKARIEDAAFCILYRRQYKAVNMLYRETGHTMKTVSNYLLSDITNTLHQDKSFMSQLDDLRISSRVKEPYSFWKKLLKRRMNLAASSEGSDGGLVPSPANGSSSTGTLSVANVPDVVAFRVVLRAKKLSDDEDDDTTRERERILCYYVQSMLQLKWGGTRLKDYIQQPKENGYQSLHHTSNITTSGGMEFPFEVQVRSREMHQAAEHGQASHWFYKLGGGKTAGAFAEPAMPLLLSSSKEIETTHSSSTIAEKSRDMTAKAFPDGCSTGSYLEALTTAKRLLQTKVHVFMAGGQETQGEGRLVSLANNAQVQDVVRVMREEVVSDCDDNASVETVWRNGRIADLNDSVVNGDVLLIASP